MKIEEKMKLCFNEELEQNKILTLNEKKVLAALMYSYKICKQAKDCIIIRTMPELRKDVGIGLKPLYEAIRNLECQYQLIERMPGETRKAGQPSIATKFILHFDKILNPPKEEKKFDFSKEVEMLKTSMSYVNTNTKVNINTNVKPTVNEDIIEVPMLIDESSIDKKNNSISTEKDEQLKTYYGEQVKDWFKAINSKR